MVREQTTKNSCDLTLAAILALKAAIFSSYSLYLAALRTRHRRHTVNPNGENLLGGENTAVATARRQQGHS